MILENFFDRKKIFISCELVMKTRSRLVSSRIYIQNFYLVSRYETRRDSNNNM